MKFKILAVESHAGGNKQLEIDADNELHALSIAKKMGVLPYSVSVIEPEPVRFIETEAGSPHQPQANAMTKPMTVGIGSFLVLLAFLFLSHLTCDPSRPSTSASSGVTQSEMQEKSLLYDTAAQADIRRMAALCGQSESSIDAMTWKAQEILREVGIEQSKESILKGMLLVYPRSTKAITYQECLASYTTLRQQGRSHSEALEQFAAIMRGLGTL